MLRSLALGALSAAAFLVAEFATAGMATFIAVAVGIGASVGNAGHLDRGLPTTRPRRVDARTGDARNDIVSRSRSTARSSRR